VFTKRIFLLILGMLSAGGCSAELLQVSADKTTYLSTDSLDAYQSYGDKMVRGLIYIKEKKGAADISLFVSSCGATGGALQFSNPDGKVGKELQWSTNGKGVVDSIGIISCRYAGYLKN